MKVLEVALAVGLGVVAGRSLLRWMRTDFDAASPSEQVMFAVHATARVGMWFALAGFFVGSAVVDHPEGLAWYGVLLVGIAGVQLVTGFLLSRSTPSGASDRGPGDGPGGSGPTMDGSARNQRPGALERDERGRTSEPGHPKPQAAEVESARLLATQARPALLEAGLGNEQIRRLADDYVAEDRGEDLAAFVAWAKARAGRGGGA